MLNGEIGSRTGRRRCLMGKFGRERDTRICLMEFGRERGTRKCLIEKIGRKRGTRKCLMEKFRRERGQASDVTHASRTWSRRAS